MTQTLIPSTAIEVVEQIESGIFPTKPTNNADFFNKYPDGTYVLKDGATIHKYFKIESNDYYVDFEKHLGGRISEAINLGNLLNRTDFEKRGCKKDDVKQIVVQMMAENEKENGDGKLSKKQVSSLLKQYPFLKPETIAQWQSYDKNSGGRRKPR